MIYTGIPTVHCHQPGKPIPALLAEALEVLQEHEHPGYAKDETNGNRKAIAPQPIWEKIRTTFSNLSEEDLNSLPVDGAAQVDHYMAILIDDFSTGTDSFNVTTGSDNRTQTGNKIIGGQRRTILIVTENPLGAEINFKNFPSIFQFFFN